jgi:hypothetical protein
LFIEETNTILEEIRTLDVSAMTPIQALLKLQELKDTAEGKKGK